MAVGSEAAVAECAISGQAGDHSGRTLPDRGAGSEFRTESFLPAGLAFVGQNGIMPPWCWFNECSSGVWWRKLHDFELGGGSFRRKLAGLERDHGAKAPKQCRGGRFDG